MCLSTIPLLLPSSSGKVADLVFYLMFFLEVCVLSLFLMCSFFTWYTNSFYFIHCKCFSFLFLLRPMICIGFISPSNSDSFMIFFWGDTFLTLPKIFKFIFPISRCNLIIVRGTWRVKCLFLPASCIKEIVISATLLHELYHESIFCCSLCLDVTPKASWDLKLDLSEVTGSRMFDAGTASQCDDSIKGVSATCTKGK